MGWKTLSLMKVLLINDYSVPVGGAETHFQLLFALLSQKDNQVSAFYPAEAGVKKFIPQLKNLLKSFKPQLVHLHSLDHKYLSLIELLSALGIPMLQTLHDHRSICLSGSLYCQNKLCESCRGGKFYQAGLKGCVNLSLAFKTYFRRNLFKKDPYQKIKFFISPSIYLKNKLKEWGFKGRIEQLYNFLPLEDYQHTSPQDSRIILFAGRLTAMKGLDTLLEAVKGLPYPLTILGEGDLKPWIEQQVAAGKLKQIELLGFKSGKEFRDVLSLAAVLVVPSPCPENNPMVIAQAFALGIPVVGSDLGGIPELLQKEECGLLFAPGNVAELREKIVYLMENPQLRVKMGKAARSFAVEHFAGEQYYSRLMRYYQELAV